MVLPPSLSSPKSGCRYALLCFFSSTPNCEFFCGLVSKLYFPREGVYILICCALCVAVPNTLHLFPLLYSISPLFSFLTLVEDFGKQLLYLIYVLFMEVGTFSICSVPLIQYSVFRGLNYFIWFVCKLNF